LWSISHLINVGARQSPQDAKTRRRPCLDTHQSVARTGGRGDTSTSRPVRRPAEARAWP
jgi:hypothetical protein